MATIILIEWRSRWPKQQQGQVDVKSRELTNSLQSIHRDEPGIRIKTRILKSLRKLAARRSRVKDEQLNKSTSIVKESREMTMTAITTQEIQCWPVHRTCNSTLRWDNQSLTQQLGNLIATCSCCLQKTRTMSKRA